MADLASTIVYVCVCVMYRNLTETNTIAIIISVEKIAGIRRLEKYFLILFFCKIFIEFFLKMKLFSFKFSRIYIFLK